MKNELKIIANYLPQYHEIEENNLFWGKGFTDWITVKRAVNLCENHHHPRVPLGSHYYDLSDENEILRQAQLAKKYGIYGFGIYHYWFSSDKQVLQKPAELILNNKNIDIHFMFTWDNVSWRRTWSNEKFSNAWAPQYDLEGEQQAASNGLLLELRYGDRQDWEQHFNYLLPFFRDQRYIKIDNKPVFAIFNQDNEMSVLKEMFKCWGELARKNGFNGITIMGKRNGGRNSFSDFELLYEPIWAGWTNKTLFTRAKGKVERIFRVEKQGPQIYDYDEIWNLIVNNAEKDHDSSVIYGAFVGYDDTPRRGSKGKLIAGATPEKFNSYMKKLINICRQKNKEFLFVTAWNEWGEGAYLEPDEEFGYSYLEAIQCAIEGKNYEANYKKES